MPEQVAANADWDTLALVDDKDLTDEDTARLQKSLRHLILLSSPASDTADWVDEVVDYSRSMLANKKTIAHIVEELTGLDFMPPELVQQVAAALAAFVRTGDTGVDPSAATTTTTANTNLPKKSTGHGTSRVQNALTMSGALGASRERKTAATNPSPSKQKKKTPPPSKEGGGSDAAKKNRPHQSPKDNNNNNNNNRRQPPPPPPRHGRHGRAMDRLLSGGRKRPHGEAEEEDRRGGGGGRGRGGRGPPPARGGGGRGRHRADHREVVSGSAPNDDDDDDDEHRRGKRSRNDGPPSGRGRGGRGGGRHAPPPHDYYSYDNNNNSDGWQGEYDNYDPAARGGSWRGRGRGFRGGGRFPRGGGAAGRGRGRGNQTWERSKEEDGERPSGGDAPDSSGETGGDATAAAAAAQHPSPLVRDNFFRGGRVYRASGRGRGRSYGRGRAHVQNILASKTWVRPKDGDGEGQEEA